MQGQSVFSLPLFANTVICRLLVKATVCLNVMIVYY